jgi:hypothetical protein
LVNLVGDSFSLSRWERAGVRVLRPPYRSTLHAAPTVSGCAAATLT